LHFAFDTAMLTAFFLFLSSILSITWSLGFILISIIGIGINLHKVSGYRLEQFRKDITIASIWNNDEPEGWIAGRWFIGYIYRAESGRGNINYELYLVCTRRFYNTRITKIECPDEEESNDTKQKNTSKKKYINFYTLEGNAYWNRHYCNRPLEITKLEPLPIQTTIVDGLLENYNQRGYVVALLHGPPGKGKSMVPYFLAKLLLQDTNTNTNTNTNTKTPNKTSKVSLVDTFNPFQPGDYFNSLYNKISPAKDSPMIVVLEEIDLPLTKMHDSSLIPHRDIPTQITNKTDWNQFFDRFDRLQYPYVYFIMTTNKSATYFDELDSSYMRPGRVNIKCQLGV
jgi:hypothetical protein